MSEIPESLVPNGTNNRERKILAAIRCLEYFKMFPTVDLVNNLLAYGHDKLLTADEIAYFNLKS